MEIPEDTTRSYTDEIDSRVAIRILSRLEILELLVTVALCLTGENIRAPCDGRNNSRPLISPCFVTTIDYTQITSHNGTQELYGDRSAC